MTKYPSPSSYYSASGNDVPLFRNEYWRHPSDYSTKDNGYGLCEMVILVIVFFIWFCSIRKLYYVWKNTLGFSEDMVQGPQGWDVIFNWIHEKLIMRRRRESLLRFHEIRVPLFLLLLIIKFLNICTGAHFSDDTVSIHFSGRTKKNHHKAEKQFFPSLGLTASITDCANYANVMQN